jgi:hypothetical protein
MAFTFQGQLNTSWKWLCSGWSSTSKMTENVKNLRTHPWWLSPNNPWASRHCWDQLWSLPEILAENLNRPHTAPLWLKCARPNVSENHRVCDYQQHGYCSPSSFLPRLSPLWFRFVSEIENETEKMTLLNSVWHPKGIDSIKENDFHGAVKAWTEQWDHCIHPQWDYY